MTVNIPIQSGIERVLIITVDCLRWDYHDAYRELYPNGIWYRGTPQATYTPVSHASLFTGLNPPRHGVLDFGEAYIGDDSLFTATDSISMSGLTDRNQRLVHGLGAKHYDEFKFTRWFPNMLANDDNDSKVVTGTSDRYFNKITEHDVTFLHDWILHGTGEEHDEEWHYTADAMEPRLNHEAYSDQRKLSTTAHRNFLVELEERGLYENTLFVIWGDHGQALHEPPFEVRGHNHFPEEGVARVPLGFCSPRFEETKIDTDTNARSVDVLPTLQTLLRQANLDFDDLSHEVEGVDLTDFRGELAGYTLSDKTQYTGSADGIRSASHALVKRKHESQLLKTYDEPQEDFHLQHECSNPLIEQKLTNFYNRVRAEPDKLILNHEPDEERLRALGYID